jgi:hypothetical protein
MSSKIFFWLLTTILLITTFACAETLIRSNGNIGLQISSNDLLNTTIKSEISSTYDYTATNPLYKVSFDVSDTKVVTSPIKVNVKGYDLNLIPISLDYYDDIKLINSIKSVEKPESLKEEYQFSYLNLFGEGINLIYKTESTQIKEEILIKEFRNIPEFKEIELSKNPIIAFNFEMVYNSELSLFIDGELKEKDFEQISYKIVEIKNIDGETIYKLMKPIAFDYKGEKIELTYTLKRIDGKIFIQINVPYLWLKDKAIYPVIIDPTIILVDEFNATILISPEVNECSYLDCGSSIKIINTGTNNITFNTADINISIEGSAENYLYFYNEETETDVFASDEYEINLAPNQEFQLDVYSRQKSTGTWKYNVSFNYLNHTYLVDPYYVTGNSTGESTTTGTTPLTKTILNISVSSTKLYAILSSSEVSGNNGNANFLTDLLLDSQSIAEQSEESKDTNALNNYPTKAMLWVGNLTSGNHTAITRYKTQTAGDITRIRNSMITALELPTGSVISQDRNNITYTTSLVNKLNKNISVTQTGDYWIFGSAVSDTDGTATLDLRVDNIAYTNGTWTVKDARDYTGFWGQKIINLSSGNHNMSIFASSTTTGADWIRELNLMAVPLSNSYYWFNETTTETSTGSATFINSSTLRFNVTESGDYLIIGTGIYGTSANNRQVAVSIFVDGIQYCDSIRETVTASNRYPFMCQNSFNLTSGIHTAEIRYRAVAGTSAYIRQTSLLVLSKTDKMCSPRLNEDWVINDAQICDNKVVTTGTGKINITSTGSLELKNNANVTTSAISPFLHPTGLWKILVEHGSRLYPRG